MTNTRPFSKLRAIMFFLFIHLASAAAPPTAVAQQDGDPVSIGTYRVIESKVLGETRRLLISLPRGYEGSAIDYPVVYHTYGNYLSGYYAPAYAAIEALGNEAQIPQMILVGIDNIDRYRDLRPLQHNGEQAGIEAYTEFLATEVIPFVEENFRTAEYRILVGPQAAGVFGLHTLLDKPDLFDAFILDNPFSSAPNSEVLRAKAEEVFAASSELKKFCFLTFGGESADGIQQVYRFAAQAEAAALPGFNLQLNHLQGEVDFLHPGALSVGLKRLFPGYHLSREDTFHSLADIEHFYGTISLDYGFKIAPSEIVMTFSVDALREQGKVDPALEILRRQVALYPNMVNGFWRLADIATDRGEVDEAIGYYKRCVEINPSMANFVNRRIAALPGK